MSTGARTTRTARAELERTSNSSPRKPTSKSGNRVIGGAWNDVRFLVRYARRRPGFAAATVAVLGIGIGAISLMFSIFNTAVLQPLPFDEPDRLVWVWSNSERVTNNSISYLDYVDYRDGVDAFESLGSFTVFSRTQFVTGGGEGERAITRRVSASLFKTLGVNPHLGRSFVSEEVTGEDAVTVLSQGFWRRRYGGDPAAVGSTIILDGQPVEVVGVMPAGFNFPDGVDLWLPLQRNAGYAQGRGNNNFYAIGRLREGVSLQEAQAQMNVIAKNIADAHPESKAGWWVSLVWLHERLFGSARATLLILSGIIALVPLVACANVASLFMVRAATRRTELASRLALGAPRSRVIRQLLTESLVMALAGGVVGLALADVGGQVLRSFAPAALPRLDSLGVDGNVFAFTLLASLVMVPLFGLAPALRGTDMKIAETLRAGGRTGIACQRSGYRDGLVVAQVALSLVLMLASGLLVRSFINLQSQNPGFRTENLLYSRVYLPSFKYDSFEQVRQTWDEMYGRLSAVPGVVALGAIDRLPPGGMFPTNEVWAAERPPVTAADKSDAVRRFATEDYFSVMGIPLLAGRVFETADGLGDHQVTVINETLARQFFPGEDAVGRTLVFDYDTLRNLEVIGVVADVRELGPGTAAPATFYLPARWRPRLGMYLIFRAEGGPLILADALRRVIPDVDSDIPVPAVQTMRARVSDSLFQPRFRVTLVGLFALVGLLLSAIGLYGVLDFLVRSRSHEIALRLALGAGVSRATGLVVKKGMVLVGLGIVIGVVASLAGTRVIQSWLFGISTADPVTYVGASLTLVAVALVACSVPAFRAARLDPASVLQAE